MRPRLRHHNKQRRSHSCTFGSSRTHPTGPSPPRRRMSFRGAHRCLRPLLLPRRLRAHQSRPTCCPRRTFLRSRSLRRTFLRWRSRRLRSPRLPSRRFHSRRSRAKQESSASRSTLDPLPRRTTLPSDPSISKDRSHPGNPPFNQKDRGHRDICVAILRSREHPSHKELLINIKLP